MSSMKNKSKRTPYIVFVICLYFSVHNFPLIMLGSMGTKNLLYLFLVVILMVYGKAYSKYLSAFKNELGLLLLPLFYVLMRTAIGGDVGFIGRHVLGIADAFLVPLALVVYAMKNGIATEIKFMRTILVLGAVASIISFTCFLYPPLQAYIKYTVLNIQPDNYLYWTDFRGFGLAQKLTSDFAFIQGTIFVLGFFYLKDNKWFLFFLPFVLFSVMFNARTGLVILMAGMMIYVLSRKIGVTNSALGVSALALLLFLPEVMQSMGMKSDTLDWVTRLFDDMDAVAASGDFTQSRTGEKLFGSMWVLPDDTAEWILGKGYSLFRHETESNSDNGWILQLNYGGIVYMLVLYPIIFSMFKRLRNIGQNSFAWYFLVIFIIINTKSAFLPNDEDFRLLMMIYMFFILNVKNNKVIKQTGTNEKALLRSI